MSRSQAAVLADRYVDVLLGDSVGLLITLLQAPLLGLAIVGVWSNSNSDSESMYFVLSLCAFFMGTVDSAREVVKERSIFLRERMFNLRVGPYLASKFQVLAAIVLIQSASLVAVVELWIPMQVNPFAVGCYVFLVGLCGVTVGLLISSISRSSDKAMALVPLVVIPQILFSDFVIGKNRLSNWTGLAQELMPTHWAYRALVELRGNEVDYGIALGTPVVLGIMMFAVGLLTLGALSVAKYD